MLHAMLRIVFLAGLIIIAALPSDASAQQAQPQRDLSTQSGDRAACKHGADGEVVVCGERGQSPYRIDPTVLDAIRSKEAANNPPRVQDRSGGSEPCGTGRNVCSGGMIPLLEPALRVATAVVKAVEGDDWREAFRNGPDDYRRYQDAQRKDAAKRGGISIGISAGN
jgi:hypothetical protein